MSSMLGDIRLALRATTRARTISSVALLSLGLGIAATTTMFSIVNGVLVRPLPYRTPEQLVFIWDRLDFANLPRAWVTAPQVADLRDQATSFEGFAALKTGTAQLVGDGDPQQLQSAMATANLFQLLGVDVLMGRGFLHGEDDPGAENVAVISHGLWTRHFGADTEVIGRTVTLDGIPTTIVGVLPPDFNFLVHSSLGLPSGADIWQPLRANLADGSRGDHSYAVLARIRDGVSFEEAQAELDVLGQRQDYSWFGSNGFAFAAVPIRDDLVKASRPMLLLLFGSVGLVLLIACTNVAMLMMARAQQRHREAAVRRALGAGNLHMLWQAFAEAGVLAVGAAVLAVVITSIALDGVVSMFPETVPRKSEVGIDMITLAFTACLALVVAFVSAAAPAYVSTRSDLIAALRLGNGRSWRGTSRFSGSAIVVGEVALSLVLLLGAGLLVRSFISLQRAQPGFDGRDVLVADVELAASSYPDGAARSAFLGQLIDRVSILPGVIRVAAASAVPLSASASQTNARPDVFTEDHDLLVDYITVTPGYFEAMGIELLAGRDFTRADGPESRRVLIVDETLARNWPGGAAEGREINFGGGTWEVVGVVRQARMYRFYSDDRPQVYLSYEQYRVRGMSLVVQAETPAQPDLANAIRHEVRQIDSNQPIYNVRTMPQLISNSIADRRVAMFVMAGFGLAATFLALLGIYGVLAYKVANRRREIGVRMALGARHAGVVGLVLRQGLTLAIVGVALGVGGAVAASRIMARFVYGISTTDPITFVSAPLGLIGVVFVACYVPAWRASKVDPMVVMKVE